MTVTRSLKLKLIAIDPPFEIAHGVLFGVQAGREVEDPVPAVETAEFDFEIDIAHANAGVDFKGSHVNGRKGDRFLYLSWGLPDPTEPFVMFARAKIKLADIPSELLELVANDDGVLVCELQATNKKGQPASGTINSPAVIWRVESQKHVLDETATAI